MAAPSYYDPYNANADPNQDYTQNVAQTNAQSNFGVYQDQPNAPTTTPSYYTYQGSADAAASPDTSMPQSNVTNGGGNNISAPSQANLPAPTHAAAQVANANGQLNPVQGNNYGGAKDYRSLINYWQAQHPASNPDMDGLVNFLKANGVNVSRATHAGGLMSDDKVVIDGAMYDLGSSLGSGQGQWFTNFGADSAAPQYAAPTGPMITDIGTVPPGIPYTPNVNRPGFTTPPPTLDPGLMDKQNSLLNQILTNPLYDQNYINQLNEQQKEIALKRGQGLSQAELQNAARRNVTNGGNLAATQRRQENDLTNQLLQSNRDVNVQTTGANRAGFLDALSSSNSILGDRFRNQLAGNQFGLDQANAIETALLNQTAQNRQDRDLARLLSQYKSDNQYRYDALNNGNQNALLTLLMNP